MDYGSKAVNGNSRCSRDLDQETFGIVLSNGHGAGQRNVSSAVIVMVWQHLAVLRIVKLDPLPA